MYLVSAQVCLERIFYPSTIFTCCYVLCIIVSSSASFPIPISNQRTRHQPISANVKLMYNGTRSITIYFIIVDLLIWFGADIGYWVENMALILFIFVFNQFWYIYTNKTGKHLLAAWKKQGYSIKGWRSGDMQTKYINRVIVNCIHVNSAVLIGLVAISQIAQPSIQLASICSMIQFLEDLKSTNQKYRPQK